MHDKDLYISRSETGLGEGGADALYRDIHSTQEDVAHPDGIPEV